MLIPKLAYRNLLRNSRRTILTGTAISLATALVIVILGIYDGMMWDMIDSATILYHGHVKITADKYLDEKKINYTLEADGIREEILAQPGVKGVSGRIRGFALLSSGEGASGHTQPAELLGINPEQEKTVTTMASHVLEGEFISSSDSQDILLGKGLAKRLDAKIGDEIVVMGQGADGSIAADIFFLKGIVETSDPIRDTSLAVVGVETLQEMLVLDGKIHEWAIALEKPMEASEWAKDFASKVPGDEVTSWYEFLPQMKQMLDLWDSMRFIFVLIFYFAVILVAANTMFMMFLERMREFGIMSALGFRIPKLAVMIVLEGLLICGIAGVTGGIAGTLISLYMTNHPIDLSMFFSEITYAGTALQPRIRLYIDPMNIIIPVIMIIVFGMIVSVFPALKLRKFHPVDVLKEV